MAESVAMTFVRRAAPAPQRTAGVSARLLPVHAAGSGASCVPRSLFVGPQWDARVQAGHYRCVAGAEPLPQLSSGSHTYTRNCLFACIKVHTHVYGHDGHAHKYTFAFVCVGANVRASSACTFVRR